MTVFGTSPAYLKTFARRPACPRAEVFDLSALRAVLSTGSILHDRQYDWVRRPRQATCRCSRSPAAPTSSAALCSGNPNLPVHRGEASAAASASTSLAADCRRGAGGRRRSASWSAPTRSRPGRLAFFGDADGSRFHAAYFAQNPGVWTHGDLIEFTSRGGRAAAWPLRRRPQCARHPRRPRGDLPHPR